MYIGLSDLESEGTWRWLNGIEASSDDRSLWHPRHPHNGSSRNDYDCAVLPPSNLNSGFVVDSPCDVPFFALCEKLV